MHRVGPSKRLGSSSMMGVMLGSGERNSWSGACRGFFYSTQIALDIFGAPKTSSFFIGQLGTHNDGINSLCNPVVGEAMVRNVRRVQMKVHMAGSGAEITTQSRITSDECAEDGADT